MAFGRFDGGPAGRNATGNRAGGDFGGARQGTLADINMTPLIDVMLVLLVVFIITAPLFARSIGLELPRQQLARSATTAAASVAVAIDRDGHFFWAGERIDAASLDAHFAAVAAQNPQPEIALSADQRTAYQAIAAVMAAAQRAGVAHFGFVVAPP